MLFAQKEPKVINIFYVIYQSEGRDIENLRNKLIAGKNETSGGYQKFATAQFYGK